MIESLYIKNFTLIDETDIHLMPGFSVITGETGAGKSILLGAISMLLGQRADTKMIRQGSDKCIIEGHFNISKYNLNTFFDINEIDYFPEDTILRREIASNGKSRAFVNDTPVPLTVMRELGGMLMDIHSQHQNLLLQKEDFQLNVVDVMAVSQKEKDAYSDAYNKYRTAEDCLRKLREDIERNKENSDFMQFQYDELSGAHLAEGEQEELESQQTILANAEGIKGALFKAGQLLDGETDDTILTMLREAANQTQCIANVFDKARLLSERINECLIELKDIAAETNQMADAVDYDPARLATIDERLDLIYSLQKKHHCEDITQLLEKQHSLEESLNNISNGDERLLEQQKLVEKLRAECVQAGEILSKKRHDKAAFIESQVIMLLQSLGMPNVRFIVDMSSKEPAADGMDKVTFLFSANSKGEPMPVSSVASGGEVARVMLSLKAMISNAVKLPTIIFDEIDTGVSGKVADKMADIMRGMGNADRQVISITHLPQIAAAGQHHYKVYKNDTGKDTTSNITLLNDEERVSEIAQMVSGSDITDAALENARQLLKNK